MFARRNMSEMIGYILLIGTTLSSLILVVGGLFFLMEHGQESLKSELIQGDVYQISAVGIIKLALSLRPIGIIELGLFLLVATQILRVALLALYYATIRDYWFTFFSSFICAILVYSFFWHI